VFTIRIHIMHTEAVETKYKKKKERAASTRIHFSPVPCLDGPECIYIDVRMR
jgi:hypothetical protein